MRLSNANLLTDRQIAMMSDADRKALGLLAPEERQHKAEEMAERELQRLCERELSRRRIAYLHLSFRARERAGWPDLTFCLHGRFVAVELKTITGKLTPEQVGVMADLERNGALTRIVRSFEDFRELLEINP